VPVVYVVSSAVVYVVSSAVVYVVSSAVVYVVSSAVVYVVSFVVVTVRVGRWSAARPGSGQTKRPPGSCPDGLEECFL